MSSTEMDASKSEAKTTTQNTHIRKCKFGIQCRIYHKCLNIQRTKDYKQHKIDLPTYVLEHVKKFSHPKKDICAYHYTSIPESNCKHKHLGDTEEIMKYKLCYFDMRCNNPHCKYLHGWNCPFGIGCKNPNCPLIHPIINDPNGHMIDDKRRHIVDNSLYGNGPKAIKPEQKEDSKKEDSKKEETKKEEPKKTYKKKTDKN